MTKTLLCTTATLAMLAAATPAMAIMIDTGAPGHCPSSTDTRVAFSLCADPNGGVEAVFTGTVSTSSTPINGQEVVTPVSGTISFGGGAPATGGDATTAVSNAIQQQLGKLCYFGNDSSMPEENGANSLCSQFGLSPAPVPIGSTGGGSSGGGSGGSGGSGGTGGSGGSPPPACASDGLTQQLFELPTLSAANQASLAQTACVANGLSTCAVNWQLTSTPAGCDPHVPCNTVLFIADCGTWVTD